MTKKTLPSSTRVLSMIPWDCRTFIMVRKVVTWRTTRYTVTTFILTLHANALITAKLKILDHAEKPLHSFHACPTFGLLLSCRHISVLSLHRRLYFSEFHVSTASLRSGPLHLVIVHTPVLGFRFTSTALFAALRAVGCRGIPCPMLSRYGRWEAKDICNGVGC